MLRNALLILLLACSSALNAQPLTDAQKDSLAAVTCEMVKADQKYRQMPYSDSIARAYRNKDTAGIMHFADLLTRSDSSNFSRLEDIIRKYGYPGEKLVGKNACNLLSVFIHWQNGYPAWFNSLNTSKAFKKEIQKGNMPVMLVDSAHAYFIKHTTHDLEYMEMMNAARKTYFLKQYTEQQFMRQEPIAPVKQN
jgi:hypothetical protein